MRTLNFRRSSRRRTPGFTIMELMVAVGIVILLTILTVPAFRAMKANLDASAAENTVSVVLNQARNMALRGDHGDTAVVFLYDRPKKMYTLLVASQRVQGVRDGSIDYDVFAPIEGTRERRLPSGWEVRGLGYGSTSNWYNHTAQFGPGDADEAWLFPESDRGFSKRQTFMVRFAASTGTVITSNEQFASAHAWLYVNPNAPFGTFENLDEAQWKQQIFDHGIHLRPTPALALYSVDDLVDRASGAEIDPATGTLYGLNYDRDDGDYLASITYQPLDPDAPPGVSGYDALFYFLDENADPIVFNRFTGMIMRSRPQ